jgi:hypothetical protein
MHASTPPLTLSHNHTAHENLDRPDTLKRHFALTRRLIQTQDLPQLILADRVGVVDLVAENDEGGVGELLHGEESIELCLGLVEALMILGIDKEDDAADFGKVIAPEAAGLRVATQVEGRKFHVAY